MSQIKHFQIIQTQTFLQIVLYNQLNNVLT